MGQIETRIRATTQRIAIPVLSVLIATVFFLVAVVAIFVALFLWLTPILGSILSALVVAASALMLAALVLLPLLVKRHPQPSPQPAGIDFATFLPSLSTVLKLRPLLLGALLVAILAMLTSKPADGDGNPGA